MREGGAAASCRDCRPTAAVFAIGAPYREKLTSATGNNNNNNNNFANIHRLH